MNIRPLTFVDSWAFASILHGRYKDRFTGSAPGYSVLTLRDHDGPLPILAEWKSAKALLSRIANAASPIFGGEVPDLGVAELVKISAGGVIPWNAEEPSEWVSLALCIVPAPGAWLYSGGEAAVLPVGQLTIVRRDLLHSAINLSNHPSITLVLRVRKTDDPLGDAE